MAAAVVFRQVTQLRCTSKGRGEVRGRGQESPRQHARVRGPGVVAVCGRGPAVVGQRQLPRRLPAPRPHLRQGPRVPLARWELGDNAEGGTQVSPLLGAGIFPGDDCEP